MNDSETIDLINRKAEELRNVFQEAGFTFILNLSEVQSDKLVIESQKFIYEEKVQDFLEYLGKNNSTMFTVMKLERIKKKKRYENLFSELEVYFRFEYLLKNDQ